MNNVNDEDSPEVMARVREALELVKPTAWRLCSTLGPRADVEEMMSCGRAAVLQAARSYDPKLGTSFQTHAKRSLERAMRTEFRRTAALPRRAYEHLTVEERETDPDAVANGKRLRDKHFAGIAGAELAGVVARPGLDSQGDALAVSAKTMPDEASHKNQLKELIASSLHKLPPDEAKVFWRHEVEDVPIDRLAKEMGLTRMKVRTLHKRAQNRLAKLLAEIGRERAARR